MLHRKGQKKIGHILSLLGQEPTFKLHTCTCMRVTLFTRVVERLVYFEEPETEKAEFANRADLDEVVLNEPPHLDLHFLPPGL